MMFTLYTIMYETSNLIWNKLFFYHAAARNYVSRVIFFSLQFVKLDLRLASESVNVYIVPTKV